MVGKDTQFTELSFDELFSAVEKVDLAHAFAGSPQHRPGFKNKNKILMTGCAG
jgi:hypothetical protein